MQVENVSAASWTTCAMHVRSKPWIRCESTSNHSEWKRIGPVDSIVAVSDFILLRRFVYERIPKIEYFFIEMRRRSLRIAYMVEKPLPTNSSSCLGQYLGVMMEFEKHTVLNSLKPWPSAMEVNDRTPRIVQFNDMTDSEEKRLLDVEKDTSGFGSHHLLAVSNGRMRLIDTKNASRTRKLGGKKPLTNWSRRQLWWPL